MNKQALWAITKKDLWAIKANFQVWLAMLIVPILLGVVLPGIFVGVSAYAPMKSSDLQEMAGLLQRIGPLLGASGRPLAQQMVLFMANYALAPFFLLIPLMTASVISADSFAGEKERGTLETLLFAPVDLLDLFMGKVLASFLPAILVSLGTFVLCAITVNALGWHMFGGIFFPTLNWLPLMLLVIPLISLLSILLNVFISAKVATFQAAYQLGALLALPAILLVVGQISGFLMLGIGTMLIFAVVLALIDVGLLQLLLKRLNRSALFESQVR